MDDVVKQDSQFSLHQMDLWENWNGLEKDYGKKANDEHKKKMKQ